MEILRIEHLTKTYANGTNALSGISFAVEKGDFFAFLGQNGAGKTTTISILTGLVKKTSGKVYINSIDFDKTPSLAKSMIGVVPQEFNFFPFAKVIDIITDQAGYYGVPFDIALERAEMLLRQLHLWEKRNDEARSLSGGMKRRLMIARGLIHNPHILLLDEPTAGVDVELRKGMWEFLKTLNTQGLTIILTTHYLEEVEQLCNNLAIVSKGKIVKEGNVHDIISTHQHSVFVALLNTDEKIYEIHVPQGKTLMQVIDQMPHLKPHIISISPKENALEEIFLAY